MNNIFCELLSNPISKLLIYFLHTYFVLHLNDENNIGLKKITCMYYDFPGKFLFLV